MMETPIEAIVYTSNTGYTKEYAEMLSKKMGLPVFSLKEAKEKLKNQAEILYLGWIMAGNISGYEQAKKRYKVVTVCAVGMGPTGTQLKTLREQNDISEDFPLFSLQGGYDFKKLKGMYKIMMWLVGKKIRADLGKNKERNEEEEKMLQMITGGGDYVSEENIVSVLKWHANR